MYYNLQQNIRGYVVFTNEKVDWENFSVECIIVKTTNISSLKVLLYVVHLCNCWQGALSYSVQYAFTQYSITWERLLFTIVEMQWDFTFTFFLYRLTMGIWQNLSQNLNVKVKKMVSTVALPFAFLKLLLWFVFLSMSNSVPATNPNQLSAEHTVLQYSVCIQYMRCMLTKYNITWQRPLFTIVEMYSDT